MSKSRRMILDFQKAKGQKIDDIISELLQEPCRQIKEIVVAELSIDQENYDMEQKTD